jgi:hypothetical protein
MSYEEEDTYIQSMSPSTLKQSVLPSTYMSYEEEDTYIQSMLPLTYLSYEEEDTCHMRRRIHTFRACCL